MRRFIPATALAFMAASLVSAAGAEVGDIDLAGHECTTFADNPVSQICYRPHDGNVVAVIQDNSYVFCEVSLNLVTRWLSAGSQAQYYNAIIDGKFPCE